MVWTQARSDGYMNTNDNYYLNGEDGIAGTMIWEAVSREDGKYGTKDDYYLDKEDHKYIPKW